MSNSSSDDELDRYVKENSEFLTRLLRHGNDEAQGYALALLANGGSDRDVDAVIQELENLCNGGE